MQRWHLKGLLLSWTCALWVFKILHTELEAGQQKYGVEPFLELAGELTCELASKNKLICGCHHLTVKLWIKKMIALPFLCQHPSTANHFDQKEKVAWYRFEFLSQKIRLDLDYEKFKIIRGKRCSGLNYLWIIELWLISLKE